MTITERLPDTYRNMRNVLESESIVVSECKDIAYGIQFSVAYGGCVGVLRVYQNAKGVLRNDYSQLKNGELALKVKTIIEQRETPKKENLFIGIGFPIIGTDESGKGDYFGPLVSAAVYVDEQTAKLLAFEGVRDSKKLSDKKMRIWQKKSSISVMLGILS